MKKLICILCLIFLLSAAMYSCDSQKDDSPESEKSSLTDASTDEQPADEQPADEQPTEAPTESPAHEHSFGEELAYDDAFHGYPCAVEGCGEMKDREEHTFGSPEVTYSDGKVITKRACLVCGFEKAEEQAVSTEIDGALTWDEVFKSFKPTNYTLIIKIETDLVSREHNCIVTEDGAYVHIPGQTELYTLSDGNGKYVTYGREDGAENFTISSDDSDQYYVWAKHAATLNVSFEENFDKFAYDEESGSYKCAEVIPAMTYAPDGSPLESIYCYDCTVMIVDGRISYLSASYMPTPNPAPDEYFYLCYSDIGTSVVEIPQSVIDSAIPEA